MIVREGLPRAGQAADRNTKIGTHVIINGKHGRIVAQTRNETFVEFDGGGHIIAIPKRGENG